MERSKGTAAIPLKERREEDIAAEGSVNEPLKDVNASGHVQQLDRNFNLISICAVGIVTGNTWAALGGSIAVAIYNGGPPGVIYEFITDSVCYWFVAASIAELASAIPSAAGVYHWASVTPGARYGGICSFFAGFWNLSAYILGGASISSIVGNMCVQMYATNHPEFVAKPWHVFVAYIIVTWCACATVLFMNRAMPSVQNLGIFLILAGVLVTILVCAIMPGNGGRPPHASNEFVWTEWSQDTGYSSDGFVYLMGMLNAAFAVGVPDVVSHVAEEVPNPESNLPKAILAQIIIGFTTGLAYLIAIFYAINDLDSVLSSSNTFPLADIYRQATGSRAGAVGLVLVVLLPSLCNLIGIYIITGRTLWTLARDDAAPFSAWLGQISPRFRNPFNATITCCGIITVLGCIYVGSTTAFSAFVGSYEMLSTLSFLITILPNLLTGRRKIIPGPFRMSNKIGFVVNTVACVYIAVFLVIFAFPYTLPVSAQNMNYACLITGGFTVFIALWWMVRSRRGYVGPKVRMGHASAPSHIQEFGNA
ncbi:MAG: hypothetical protein M4579_003778 [Chaenotheca gracillima]|nr:MAG: hypothetical protein M4579_003778 [Chaenotheca gracillima]